MTIKKQTLAMCISLALVGSLTACSGSKNQSTPAGPSASSQAALLKTAEEKVAAAEAKAKSAEEKASAAEVKAKSAEEKAAAAEARAKALEDKAKTEENRLKAEQDKIAAEKLAEEERLKAEQARIEAEKAKEEADRLKAEQDRIAAENAKAEEARKNREKLETALDPNGQIKWRQTTQFIDSSSTSASNPLQAGQNGKLSPQEGAAAYLNGMSQYKDGETVKDFRKDADRATTDYDPSFTHKADIDPAQVQHLAIRNKAGETVANIHFVNQTYSTYSTWKSAEVPKIGGDSIDSLMSGYLAIPTKPSEEIDNKGQVIYRGHTLAQKTAGSSEIHKGDIELNVDFGTKKLSGKLTNRNDMLLDSSVNRFYPDIYDVYTTDADDLEYDPKLILLSQAEFDQKQADWNKGRDEKIQHFRTVDVNINTTDIKNGDTVSFHNPLGALSYQDGEKTRNTGVIGGIFAGDKAQEAVGEIQGSSHFMSFGATEVAK